jgi:hypothetical protein
MRMDEAGKAIRTDLMDRLHEVLVTGAIMIVAGDDDEE